MVQTAPLRVVVDGKKLRAARVAKLLSVEQLAKRAGLSVKTQQKMESGSVARLSSLQLAAQALGIDAAKLVVRADEPEKAAPPGRVRALYEPTQLERIAEEEESLPPGKPLRTAQGDWEPLTARRLQEIYTAYAAHEGARVYFEGRVRTHRGASVLEARLLGSRPGVAARFFLERVVGTHVLSVTVHAREVAHTRALLAARGQPARVLASVALVPEDAAARGGGFDFFGAQSKRPWGLVVEGVVAASRAKAR